MGCEGFWVLKYPPKAANAFQMFAESVVFFFYFLDVFFLTKSRTGPVHKTSMVVTKC